MSAMRADPNELQERIGRGPFHKFLGMRVVELDEGYAKLLLPFKQEILANEHYIHGGVIAAFIDVVGDWAVATAYGRTVPTVDMRVDYLSSGRPGEDLTGEARVIKLGRTLSVADIHVLNPAGKVLAVGRALYSTPAEAVRS